MKKILIALTALVSSLLTTAAFAQEEVVVDPPTGNRTVAPGRFTNRSLNPTRRQPTVLVAAYAPRGLGDISRRELEAALKEQFEVALGQNGFQVTIRENMFSVHTVQPILRILRNETVSGRMAVTNAGADYICIVRGELSEASNRQRNDVKLGSSRFQVGTAQKTISGHVSAMLVDGRTGDSVGVPVSDRVAVTWQTNQDIRVRVQTRGKLWFIPIPKRYEVNQERRQDGYGTDKSYSALSEIAQRLAQGLDPQALKLSARIFREGYFSSTTRDRKEPTVVTLYAEDPEAFAAWCAEHSRGSRINLKLRSSNPRDSALAVWGRVEEVTDDAVRIVLDSWVSPSYQVDFTALK